MVEEHGDRIKVVYRHFPLPSHKYALTAAEATEAAGEQGKFWEMLDRLFAAQPNLNEEVIYETARSLGLDMTRFKAAMTQGRYLNSIRADIEEARGKGINATPTFIIGKTVLRGLPTYEKLEAAVLKELSSR